MNGRTGPSAAFLGCLEELDASLMRRMWGHFAPHLPQPEDDEEALVTLHMARTQCPLLTDQQRAYSHCWLRERSLPSQLPDHMRASAERMYPRIVRAVGISVNATSEILKPLMIPVREAMEHAVMDIHADDPDLKDDALVKQQISEAKARTLKQLLGLRN